MMRLERPVRATFTFEVWQEHEPARGRRYRDPRGRDWTVRGAGRASPMLMNPPPPADTTRWNVVLEAEHPAYQLEPGEELVPVWTLDDVRAARELARDMHPEVVTVGSTLDDQRLLFWIEPGTDPQELPGTFMGMPVDVRSLESRA